MTSELFWPLRASALLGVIGGTGLLVSLALLPDGPLRALVFRYAGFWERRLRFLRLDFSPLRVALMLTIAPFGMVVGGVATGLWPWALAGVVVGAGPMLLVERARLRRVAGIDEAVEPWLGSVANALKANPSLGEAIASTIKLAPAPICDELDVTVKEYELGTPLDVALEAMAERTGSRRLAGGILALKVARNAGGNLPKTLEDMGEALRELARLEAVVRTKTAEGRMQAWVVGALPLPLVLGVHLMDPEFLAPLFETLKGQLLGAVGLALWGLALFLARKILDVDV